MERIAPLAKILAEANGIEWQQLKGTGAGGMIVEQDILDYLSRVMSGEAEPPSTPVDAPPPDWNGEDIPGAGMFDANMLSQAGVESDIADFVSQSRPAQPAPAAPQPTLDADDFELDDADDDVVMAPATPAPAPAAPSFGLNAGAPSLGGMPAPSAPSMPSASSMPSFSAPAAPQPIAPEPVVPAAAPAPAPTPTPAAPAGGLNSLLSRLYHKDAPVETPAPPTPAVSAPSTPSFTPAQPEPTPAPSFGSSSSPYAVPPVELREQPAPAAPSFSFGKTPAADDVRGTPVVEPVVAEPSMPVPTMPAPVLSQPTLAEPEVTREPEVVAEPEPVVPAVEPEPVQVDEPVREPEPVQVPQEREPVAPEREERVDDVAPITPVPAAAPTPAASVSQGSQGGGPSVWFGTYLRRDASVAQLHELRDQLSEALEREVPLALLVARAAQRHASALGLETVAMRDMERGSTRQMGGQVGSSVSLRDALIAVDEAFDGTPDLLVVDAGSLDMDDLHYPDTLTLSVGRVQDGRASLSLQGDVDQEKAARFLASVAQTLEKPVILLV